jgi:hypothetical protein
MADVIDQSFVIGSTEDLEQFERDLQGFDASILERQSMEGKGALVFVRAPSRFRDDLVERLGPNAQATDRLGEAQRVWDAAAVRPAGSPHEERRRDTA